VSAAVDFRIFDAVNDWTARHAGLGHAVDVLMNVCVVGIVVAAVVLWFAARPGGSTRWKRAAGGALISGALAFAVNQVIHALYDRARPYEAHHGVWHPYANGTDASFPSDHSSAAFGIAWAVFIVDRAVGALFLAVATVVAVSRVVVGAHYPGDVLAGAGVGLASALVVVVLCRRPLQALVRLVARLTDPVVRPLWQRH
jgi:membrane-associated phospholipid phosphatase